MTYLKLPRFIPLIVKGAFFICVFFFLSNSLFAQNISVPENIQAALLSKVLKYNPQIPKNQKIKILVVYNKSSENNKDEFIEGLNNSLEIQAVYPNEIEQHIVNTHVVYFMAGIHDYAALCKKYNVLSVTGFSKDVEEGEVSLGFVIKNNKPIIVVNLNSLDKEEQSFSSDILRISKIYK